MLSPESTSSASSASYYQYRLAQNGHSSGNGGLNGLGPNTPPIKKEDNTLSNRPMVPQLLQEIMDVEHLWQMNEAELSRLNSNPENAPTGAVNLSTNPLLAGIDQSNSNPDMIANLCNIADHRLYKIVKWCKSLPLFKHISVGGRGNRNGIWEF